MNQCIICNVNYNGFGHNAHPVADGRCCDSCNTLRVVPTRIASIFGINRSTEHKHRLRFGFEIDPSSLLSIVQDIMGYDDSEVVTIEPNSVFDVIVSVVDEEYDADTFMEDLHHYAQQDGGEQ
mgnify:CR=1 FL=1